MLGRGVESGVRARGFGDSDFEIVIGGLQVRSEVVCFRVFDVSRLGIRVYIWLSRLGVSGLGVESSGFGPCGFGV